MKTKPIKKPATPRPAHRPPLGFVREGRTISIQPHYWRAAQDAAREAGVGGVGALFEQWLLEKCRALVKRHASE
jgi:hypothetical protein